jgi:hypothetical protein
VIKRLIQIVAVAGVIASGFWLRLAGGLEPLVTLISSIGTFLVTLGHERSSQGSFRLGRLKFLITTAKENFLRRILGHRYRRWAPEGQLTFYWPSAGNVKAHKIVATRLWNHEGPTEIVALTHLVRH